MGRSRSGAMTKDDDEETEGLAAEQIADSLNDPWDPSVEEFEIEHITKTAALATKLTDCAKNTSRSQAELTNLQQEANLALKESKEFLEELKVCLQHMEEGGLSPQIIELRKANFRSLEERHQQNERQIKSPEIQSALLFGNTTIAKISGDASTMALEMQVEHSAENVADDAQDQMEMMILIEQKVQNLKRQSTEMNQELVEQTAMVEVTSGNQDLLKEKGDSVHGKLILLIEELDSWKRWIIIFFLVGVIGVLGLLIYLDTGSSGKDCPVGGCSGTGTGSNSTTT